MSRDRTPRSGSRTRGASSGGPQEIWSATRWSLIRRLTDREDGERFVRAWEEFLSLYRRPIEACLRRRLSKDPRLEEAVGGFWGWLFERGVLARLREDRRLRASIQVVVRNYAFEWRRSGRALAGARAAEADPDPEDPAQDPFLEADEHEWANALLERALDDLARTNPRSARMLERRYGLRGQPALDPTGIAAEFGLTVNAANQAVDRARRKLAELLDAAVRDITDAREEYVQERDVLFGRLLEANPALPERALAS